MKISILYICTGKYSIFWKDFYLSCEKYFVPDVQKEYYIFTDSPDIVFSNKKNVHRIYQENLGWPYNTLNRYKMFSSIKSNIISSDFCFFFNSNLLFLSRIDLSDVTENSKSIFACLHPGFYMSPLNKLPFEKKKESTAYFLSNSNSKYFQGAINGASTKKFIEIIDLLNIRINNDLNNKIVAKWHDESHWNRYVNENIDDVKVLSPSFLYPENSNLPFEAKILIRNKDQFGSLNRIRNIKKIIEKKEIIDILKRIARKLVYFVFVVFDVVYFSRARLLKQRPIKTNDLRQISVVITYYNRHEIIHESLFNVINDDRVSEVLIVDDLSSDESFKALEELTNRLDRPKVKVIRNDFNRGMYLNKIHAVSQAKNDWIGLLDSDNTLLKKYLDSVFAIENWNKTTMYCPSFSFPLLDHRSISGEYNLAKIKQKLIHDSTKMKSFLNVGNFFVNKDTFAKTIEPYREYDPHAADSVLINYSWLKAGNNLSILGEGWYIHRISFDSTWNNSGEKSLEKFEHIKNTLITDGLL